MDGCFDSFLSENFLWMQESSRILLHDLLWGAFKVTTGRKVAGKCTLESWPCSPGPIWVQIFAPFLADSLQGIGIEFWLAWIPVHSFVLNSICNPFTKSGKVYLKIHDWGWDLRMQTWAGCNCWPCPVDPIEFQFFASFNKGTKNTGTRKYEKACNIQYIEYLQMYWRWTFSSWHYKKRIKLHWYYNFFFQTKFATGLIRQGTSPQYQ